jgi:hypothetical protein
MRIRFVAISLLAVAMLGLGVFWNTGSPVHPRVEEARAQKGFAARCTFQRGQPGACVWSGRTRAFRADCRMDCFAHENANPGHRCDIEEVE